MTLIDTLASEYHWPAQYIRRLPLAEAFCYQEAILARHDINTGAPSFVERDIIKDIRF